MQFQSMRVHYYYKFDGKLTNTVTTLNTAMQNKISHISLWLISVKPQNLDAVPAV